MKAALWCLEMRLALDTGLDVNKPVFHDLLTTKGQTSLRRLLSAFVIRFFGSIISEVSSSQISIF